eukprot:1740104-Heterocapsa_arctica.AAC.1
MPPPAHLQLLWGPPSSKPLQGRDAAAQRRPRDTARSEPGHQQHQRPPSDSAQLGRDIHERQTHLPQ